MRTLLSKLPVLMGAQLIAPTQLAKILDRRAPSVQTPMETQTNAMTSSPGSLCALSFF
ncbi:hypothetical protein ABIB00_006870 [Bradyrhizobium sp. LB14.3]|uniref:hypothetical protein n=1 Tax=Bradyrhizobium sp. LB14.3 TaxID=3156328 RepID=UPI003399C616